jgi:RNA polymerase sigma-70 factor (ECF subfamily)
MAVPTNTAIAGCSPYRHLDQATNVFLGARPRLFGIAYRILRNSFEAEDVVHDAWLRWQCTDRSVVINADAFLATTTTRLALNQAQSAWHRRERTVGPLLPEPAETASGPEPEAERADAVGRAVLLMLATLTPAERATYVLREVFDYPYARIAELLHLSSANCRQLVRRARQGLTSERRRPVSVMAHKRFLLAFLAAAGGGPIAVLEQLLVSDAAAQVRSVSGSCTVRYHAAPEASSHPRRHNGQLLRADRAHLDGPRSVDGQRNGVDARDPVPSVH